ncbi:MAG TPA: PAS domain S-box protein, partial [Rhodocyclaceae bacterium]
MTRRSAHDPPRHELRWPQYVRERIAERIAITSALITLAFALSIGAISLAYTLHLTREAAQMRLEEDTRDAANRLSQLVDGAFNDIRLLAGNPTVIETLAGRPLSPSALAPLLVSFHPAGREPVILCAANDAGEILACDRRDLPVDPVVLDATPSSAQLLARGELTQRGEQPHLRLTAPALDANRRLRGFVVGEYAIERLIISALGNPANYYHLHLVGNSPLADEGDLFMRGAMEQAKVHDRPLDVDPALRPLALRLHLGIDDGMIWTPTRNVLLVYVAVLAALLPLVYLAARKSGYALSARLRRLAAETRALASGEQDELPTGHYGSDEIGDLARAFGEVIGDLRQSRAELATRVDQRTRELQASLDEVRALNTAIGQSAVSVIITDCNGTIRFVNADFERVTGYRRQEIVGQTARVLKSGRTLPFEYGSLWATITAGKIWRGEFENRRKDGSHYFAQASIAPIRSDAGEITGFVAVEEDITERKQFEREIRDRENYLRTLVDSLPDTLLVLDHAGRIQQLRAPDAHLGSAPGTWTSDWCLGRHYAEVLPREIAGPITTILPEILQGPEHREFAYTIRHAGEKRHYAASIRRIDDEDPARAGCVILSRDVSEAFALQAKLIRAEARFRTLLEDIDTVAVQGYDRRRQVIFWNRASERLYGWRSDEAIGRRLEDLIVADDVRDSTIAAVRAAIEKGQAVPPGECTVRRKNGIPVYVYSCSAVQTNLAGEPELFRVDIDLS